MTVSSKTDLRFPKSGQQGHEARIIHEEGKKASERFWKLEERIRSDRRHPGVIMTVEKSSAVFDIIDLIKSGVITYDDLADFSEELQQAVKVSF